MQAETQAILEIFGEALLADTNSTHVKEAFSQVTAMIRHDDHGWQLYSGSGSDPDEQYGLTLEDLKSWGSKIRPAVIAAPWVGRGLRLRHNYINKGGIRHSNIPSGGQQGSRNIQAIIDRPGNQFHFFGAEARRAREECLYTEGIAFWIGNERTKNLEAIPLRQIKDELREPNGLGYAIAYLREWSEYDLKTGEPTPHQRWYFTDRAVEAGLRVPKIQTKGDPEPIPVDQKHVIFDQIANRSTGLVYGSPDALAAYIWNQIAVDATHDGRSMQRALAVFALKATVASKDAAESAAIKLATVEGAGNTHIGGAATDLVPLSSAGKGYDFKSIQFLVAIVASALDVSVVHLTADPGSAGSSYSAAETLDLPTRLAMEARRELHIDLEKRVLSWMGVKDPEVSFLPFSDGQELYRAVQAIILGGQAGVYSPQEVRDLIDDLYGRANGQVPEGVIPWNNEKALELQQAATQATQNQSVASPAQGRSNSTNGQDGGNASNDIRRD